MLIAWMCLGESVLCLKMARWGELRKTLFPFADEGRRADLFARNNSPMQLGQLHGLVISVRAGHRLTVLAYNTGRLRAAQ